MKLNYFIPKPQSLEELKKRYRVLALRWHPDRATGCLIIMKAVNAEYEELFPLLKNVRCSVSGETYRRHEESTEVPSDFINIINTLVRFVGIKIEVVGVFLWVSGNTINYREDLKSLRFRWSKSKSAWYLSPDGYKKKSRKQYSMDEIRTMWGTQEVEPQPRARLVT